MDHKTFIDKLSKATQMEKKEVAEYLDAFITTVENVLGEGDIVSIPSFGNFETRKRNERIMTHPSEPGKRLLVPPKIVVNFKPSAVLKNKLNEDSANE